MNDTELIEKVQMLLDVQAAADRFSGSVLVAHERQIILAMARGYAIHPDVLPNRPDTKFNIASVTKMLTAVAVMKLVAAGKLDCIRRWQLTTATSPTPTKSLSTNC